jgi:predicted molibdopterin-dependent oxidoreductase YjgC
VLPAASFLEQDGTTTNFYGRVQALKEVFRPRERRDADGNTLSACAPDWMIFTKLALLLGAEWTTLSVADWTSQIATLPSALPSEVRFTAASGLSSAVPAAPEDTFLLLSGSLLYDGGESFGYTSQLKQVVPEPFIKLNRKDARKLGIENKALVEVRTVRGSVKVRAKVGREVKESTAWLPWRLRDIRANTLLDANAPGTFARIAKVEDAPNEGELSPVVMTAE